ncbi:MAG: recombinase family protein, partial [Ruminococcus sp.]|nr:recombinase family protein [Ruminococcus sp.]
MARCKRNVDKSGKLKKETAIKTWKIAVYIRLSREDGNIESESVINQKKILAEYLEEYFDDKFEFVGYYIDDGLSGTDDSRKDFMRMIQDIEEGLVNCIVCKTLSRAFRNYSDQGYYLEYYFPQKQVRFISTGDPKIDTFTQPEVLSGLEVPITGLMNDRYAAKTSSDIRRTFATKRRNGEFIGAFPPYGYLKDPKNKNHLVLDEEIVPIKKEIYFWIVNDGMSLRGAAKKLNDLGVPNPTSYKLRKGWNYCNPNSDLNDGLWTGQTVKRVLLDKVNLGHMVQGKQRVVSYKVHDKVAVPEDEWIVKENTHEPTFTQDEYNRVERLLLRDTRTANGSRTLHLFSGFMRCFDCDKALERRCAKGYVYYACRTYT